MTYIPDDARWYLADLVIEHKIGGDTRNVVHINTVLVRANSPEWAYARAIKLGQEAEYEYENADGKMVQVVFHGLRNLNVIHGKLRHGAELIYEEKIGLQEKRIAKLISPKSRLGVFEERRKPSRDAPNYMPKDIMDKMKEAGFDESDLYS